MTDDLPILDPAGLQRLSDMTGGDAAFVDELVATFLEDAVGQLASMSVAATAGSAADMVLPAHSLKSNSANVGAMRLSELARALEADARSGSLPDAEARVAIAGAELEAVRALLAARGAG